MEEPIHVRDEENQKRSLSEFTGKKNRSLFLSQRYDQPGCTTQACEIRDNYHELQENNIVVLGVSYDAPASHKLFKEKHHLPFILLSDTTKEVAKKYGAYTGIINNLFPERKTFLINEQGKIIKIMENVNVQSHVNDILESFKAYEEKNARQNF